MDVVHLDTNWFAVDWRCDVEFAPDRFPDPEGFCRALAADGIHLSLWQMPYLVEGTRLHDRLARAGGFVRSRDGGLLDIGVHFVRGYQGPVHVVDRTNPEAGRVMTEEYGRLLATGASVAKVDFGEELPDEAVYANGTPAERMRTCTRCGTRRPSTPPPRPPVGRASPSPGAVPAGPGRSGSRSTGAGTCPRPGR
jgi:alpha-glucosidase (family GH31 glycosyl hydrolase)